MTGRRRDRSAALPYRLAATGLEVDRRWIHLGSVQEVVVGLLLFVIAAVMTLGREIEDDNRGFV